MFFGVPPNPKMSNKRLVLRWVLNYQRAQNCEGQVLYATGTKQEQHARDNLRVAKSRVEADGHSGQSYTWTKEQAQRINEMGWNEWLKSGDADKGF